MQGLLHRLHRGTPNRSDHARPELRFVYTRPWYTPGQSIEGQRSGFGQLSERGKTLLASSTLTD